MHDAKSRLVTPELTLRAAARAVLAHHFERMRANEAGTAEGSDPEPLHDMRVATRRLRAAFRVFREVLDRDRRAAFNEEARWVAQTLGAVRDLDVFLEWLRERAQRASVAQQPVLLEIIAERESARAERRRAVVEVLASDRFAAWITEFQAFLTGLESTDAASPPPPLDEARVIPELMRVACVDEATARGWLASRPRTGDESECALTEFAVAAIRREQRRLRKFPRKLRADDLEPLHRVRIAGKRLRYACEFFRDLFADRLTPALDRLVELQDALGAMRDAHLQAESLRPLLRAQFGDLPRRMALLQILRTLRQRERNQYLAFRSVWRDLNGKAGHRRLARALEPPDTA